MSLPVSVLMTDSSPALKKGEVTHCGSVATKDLLVVTNTGSLKTISEKGYLMSRRH